mgnify:CR=1 FL=1
MLIKNIEFLNSPKCICKSVNCSEIVIKNYLKFIKKIVLTKTKMNYLYKSKLVL